MTFFFSFIEYILTFTPDKEEEIMEEQNNCLTKSDTSKHTRGSAVYIKIKVKLIGSKIPLFLD